MTTPAAILQARLGSTRLPGKALLSLGGIPLLGWSVRRLEKALGKGAVIVATTEEERDDAIEAWCKTENVPVYRGESTDLLARFIGAAQEFGVETIVRACADNPFVDDAPIRDALKKHAAAQADLTAVCGVLGTGVEIVQRAVLERIAPLAHEEAYREHVTTWIYNHPTDFSILSHPSPFSHLPYRLTLDEEADYRLCSAIICELTAKRGSSPLLPEEVSIEEIVALLQASPALRGINEHVTQKDWRAQLQKEEVP